MNKQEITAALRQWVAQRPGLEFGNYGDVPAYRAEMRAITRQRHEAEALIRFVELADSITAADLERELDGRNRLQLAPTPTAWNTARASTGRPSIARRSAACCRGSFGNGSKATSAPPRAAASRARSPGGGSMLKHTPGPWAVDMDGSFYSVVAKQGKKWNNPTICALHFDATPADSVTIGHWLRHYDNAEANARLIAAAPDLLAALENAVVELAENAGSSYRPAILSAAIAAIAKAKGE